MMMARETGLEVSKVDREKLVACMTCPLCNKLFRDATTISECLHTFCRKCIYEKITQEELDSCPVCNIDLGCAPLEKLRADNIWQDIRIKIFPSKRKKSKGGRRERSLSSLVVSTPKVSTKSSLIGRRSGHTTEKTTASEDSPFLNEENGPKQEDHPQNLISPENCSKVAQNNRQKFSVGESSKQCVLDRSTKRVGEAFEEKADLWKSLNCLVEAASKTKPNRFYSQGSIAKQAAYAHDKEVNLPFVKECGNGSNLPNKENDSTPEPSTSVRTRRSRDKEVNLPTVKECGSGSNVPNKESGTTPEPSTSVRTRRFRALLRKTESLSERLNIPAQAVVDSSNKIDGRFSQIWFSLVASQGQEGDAPLPQISSCYLRVKDGSLPVSTIKKYIVRKLGLSSETEVEICLGRQPLLSTLQLHNLAEWWVQTTPQSDRIQTFVGSSAKDFVMVLSYSRKAQPP